MLRDHGTWELADVLDFAIGYASDGYPASQAVATYIQRVADFIATHWPTSAATYLVNGQPPAMGDLITNPVLAQTYRRLLNAGRVGTTREARIDAALKAWSTGFVAEAIDDFVRIPHLDSTGEQRAGVLTGQDMAEWAPGYESTAAVPFAGRLIHKTKAWGQGPALLQCLRLLGDDAPAPASADAIHQVVESMKLAFADRAAWYGDAKGVPLDDLLSVEYARDRRALIGPVASDQLRPGNPGGRSARLAHPVHPLILPEPAPGEASASVTLGEPNVRISPVTNLDRLNQRTDTVNITVADRWGTMVTAMPSGGWLHASPVIPELGFGLGTRLQMTWLEQGLPNSLTPGRRPLTTLSPSMVTAGDEPVLAFGSPGGDQQDQWQLQLLLHHFIGGDNLQLAIERPSFHSLHWPNSFYPHEAQPAAMRVEGRTAPDVVAGLRAKGHLVDVSGPWALGRLSAIARDPGSAVLRGAANPRGMQGYAMGR